MKKLSKLLIVVTFLLTTFCSLLSTSEASVPHLLNYQGRLTDSSGTPLNGSYILTFRIYDSETAGNLLWEETHSGAVIQKGIFSLLLGSVTNLDLPFDKQYFLEIKVGEEVLSPRQRIASSGYAIRAEVAEHGVPRGVVVIWSGSIASIPSGWALCDGTNGTPDLRDRFIVGATQDDGGVAKSNVTGSLAQSGNGQIPAHNHGVSSVTTSDPGGHLHTLGLIKPSNGGAWAYPMSGPTTSGTGSISSDAAGGHTHTLSGNVDNTGSGMKNVAVYYAFAFIMKL